MATFGDPTLTVAEMRQVAGAHLALFGRDDAAELLLRAANEIEHLRNTYETGPTRAAKSRLRKARADASK